MTSQPILYHLTARDHFRCLAGECPASCCSGWQIAVEPELVERWKTLPNTEDRSRFPALVRVENRGNTTQLFMTGRENLRCGLLTADGLCEAHARYGVGFTPLTCQDFPSMQEEAGVIRMESASPACPVIARRVVLDDSQPLFTRTPHNVQVGLGDQQEALSLRLTELLDRLVDENKIPVGIRLYWLAERVGRLIPGSEPEADVLALLNPSPIVLRQQLDVIESQRVDKTLQPDSVIAGSFWNLLYQLGHARGLLPEPGRHDSVLFTGLRGLPTDRRRFYTAVYAEVDAGREAAGLAGQAWYPAAANRLMQLLLLNTGFPWQPSLGDWRLSFAHAVMLYALVHLRIWLGAGTADAGAEILMESLYRTGRAFGHNTLIPEQIRANPALLQLDRYHHTLLDL